MLVDCIVHGDVTAAAADSRLENNVIAGLVRVNRSESSFIPNVKTVYDTAPPTAGTWQVGDKVWHSAPEPEGNVGWVCVQAGSPGSWKSFGQIAS